MDVQVLEATACLTAQVSLCLKRAAVRPHLDSIRPNDVFHT